MDVLETVCGNPEGVASFSPGLPYSATLGNVGAPRTSRSFSTSKRLRPSPRTLLVVLAASAATPSGLGAIALRPSQGSRVRQPWAVGRNPFGIESRSFQSPHKSMARVRRTTVIRRYQVSLDHIRRNPFFKRPARARRFPAAILSPSAVSTQPNPRWQ